MRIVSCSIERCLVLALALSLHVVAAAQEVSEPAVTSPSVSVNGRVLEKGRLRPLARINVFLLPGKLKVESDADGNFSFPEVPLGDHEIIVNVTDFKKFSRKLTVGAPVDGLRLFIERDSRQYFETTVTDQRRRGEAQKSLSQDEFLTAPGSGGDPVKAVQNLPGVNRVGGGDSRVVIQGAEPEDTSYNITGHDVPLVFHFGGLSSIYVPEAVDSVDYFSAGYGPEFSRAMGGHVGLNPRRPQLDRTRGMAFADIFNLGGLVEGPLGENSGYLISGRYSYVGEVLKRVAKDNEDFNLTVAPVFYDLNAQYVTRLNARDEFRWLSIVSQDRLEFLLNTPVGNDPDLRGSFTQKTTFYRLIPEWSRQIDARSRLKASAGFGRNDILFDVGSNYFKLKSHSLTLRSEYEEKFSDLWKTAFGLDADYAFFKIDVRIPNASDEGGVRNPLATGDLREAHVLGDDRQHGVYWRNEVKPSSASRWTLLPGVRFDHYDRIRRGVWQPRYAIRYAASDSLTWRLAGGLYVQAPSGQQLDREFGNPNLKYQRADHFAFGFDKDFRGGARDGATVNLTAFHKKLSRLAVGSSSLVVRDGRLTAENYSDAGTGAIKGVEAQLKYKSDRWSWIGSYTYLVSRRKSGADAAELPSPYDQTHSVNLISSYSLPKWLIGARLRYVTGNPYTPITGGVYDADNDVFIPVRGELYSRRESAFFQADLRIDRKWIYDTWILTAYLDIQNVTNRRNQEGRTYSYDFKESEEITGLPLLPTLGVKGEF